VRQTRNDQPVPIASGTRTYPPLILPPIALPLIPVHPSRAAAALSSVSLFFLCNHLISSSCLSPVGTPYQAHGNTNSDDHYRTPNSFSDSMAQPTLMPRLATLSDTRKASHLGWLCGPGIQAPRVDDHSYSHHDVWHDASLYYQTEADCPYSPYSPLRTQSQYHVCSCSDNGPPKPSPSPSQPPFPDSFYRQLQVPENRDNSLLPSRNNFSASPFIQQWNSNQTTCPYVPSHKQNVDGPPFDKRFLARKRQSQSTSLTQDNVELHNTLHSRQLPGSLPNRPLIQDRVGSDRTRANSNSRRTNPNKKVFDCPILGCGATITTRHNFDSGYRIFSETEDQPQVTLLVGHLNSHYGLKPYRCGQGTCEKTFGTGTEVKRHRTKHCPYRRLS